MADGTLDILTAQPEAVAYVSGLIGTPYAEGATGPEAYDCWNLIAEVQHRLFGREVPFSSALLEHGRGLREILETMRAHDLQRTWLPVERPHHGDLVLMCQGMFPSHIGVWIDLGPGLVGILHCPDTGVALETVAQARASFPRMSFHRFAGPHLNALDGADKTFLEHVAGRPVAVVVKDPLNPLSEADLIELEIGQEARAALAHVDRPETVWLCLNDTPLLRRHPETGADEHATVLEADDVVWVLPPLPLGGGNQGSQVLATVLSIALSIAAPYAAATILNTTVANLKLGGKILAAGIAIGGQALISSLVPPPPVVAPLANPDPTYSFGRFGNQLRPGAPIPFPLGTMRREPDFLTEPWAEFEDNEQLVHVLLCLGLGTQQLVEFGIDDTTVWTAESGYTGSIEDAAHELVLPGEQPSLFPTAIEVSSEVDGVECPGPDPDDGPVTIGPFAAVAAGERATELILDFVFPRGLFRNSGGLKNTSVTWEISAQQIDDTGANVGFAQVLETVTLTAKTTTPQRLTKRYAVARARYKVSVTRTSDVVSAGNGSQDQLVWSALKAKRADVEEYPDVTALAIRVRADATSTSNLSNWYAVTKTVLPHFDTETGELTTGPTEQIDAAVLAVARAEYGLRLTDDEIDMEQLRTYAATWKARGDVCCTVLESEITAWEALTTVLAAGRARPSFIGNMLTFMRDERRLAAPRLITQADMVRGSFEVERKHHLSDGPRGVTMLYRDREGRMRSMLCPADADPNRAPEYQTQVMVDPEHVWREGNYLAAANILRRRYLSWVMLAGGKALIPGQVVDVSHPRPNYGRPGRVAALDGLTLRLTVEHALAAGAPGWLALTQPDGTKWGPVRCAATDDPTAVVIDADDFAAILAGAGDDDARLYQVDFREWIVTELDQTGRGTKAGALSGHQVEPTFAVVGSDSYRELKCIVAEVSPGESGQVEVLALEDADAVHDAELAPMPEQTDVQVLENDARPSWDGVVIRGEIDAAPEPDEVNFTIVGPAVPGAVRYVAETSPPGPLPVWTPLAESTSPTITGPLNVTADVLIRVAAVGPVLQGRWSVFLTDIDDLAEGVTTATFQYTIE